MAELPRAYLDQRLARQRTSAPAPGVVPRAALPAGAGLLEARGAEQLARGVAAIGETAERVASLAERMANVRATTLATEATHAALLGLADLETAVTQDTSIFPSNRLEAFNEQAGRFLETLGHDLPRDAQAQFRAHITPQLLAMRRRIETQGQSEAVKRSAEALTLTLDQLDEKILQAPSELDARRLRRGQEDIAAGYVVQGLLTPTAVATDLRRRDQARAVLTMQQRIQTEPEAALAQLLQGPEGNPALPAAQIPELVSQARQVQRQLLHDADAAEARAERVLVERQGREASQLRQQVYGLDPTAGNASKLRALMQQANTLRNTDALGEEDHTQILTTIRGMLNVAIAPAAPRDDPATLKDLVLQIEFADRPEDLSPLRFKVAELAGHLTPSTIGELNRRIETRLESTHYANRDLYRQGRDILIQAAYPEATGTGGGQLLALVLASPDTPIKTQLIGALDAYRQRMEDASQQGFRAVDQQAVPAAYELRAQYFPDRERRFRGETTLTLPPELEPTKVTDASEALRIIARLATTRTDLQSPAAQQRLFDIWQEERRRQVEFERQTGR